MLFKDTIKVKEYAEFTEVNFASIKLTIRQVEEGELVSILGNELYSSLNNAYNLATAESDLSANQQALLDACRMVIGPFISFYYTPKAEIQLSDSGPRRMETANAKTAYGYQIINFREQKLREAENACESLLAFLEANKASYPDWVSSYAFSAYRSLFIKSGAEFNKFFTSASPYRNYWAWRYKMDDVEEQVIRPALGDDLFDHLKTVDADASGVFTAAETTLLKKLKKAIAYFTVAYAIPFHAVRIDSNGITIVSDNSTIAGKDMQPRSPANGDNISQVQRNAESAAKEWLKNSLDYINKHLSDFATFTTQDDCSDDTGGNECLNGSFGLT
jgi:hypothetical protein